MRQARIKGALVGVEAVTPEGLKSVYKDFNDSGEDLVHRLQTFRRHGVHVLGSFIFGLPTALENTFQANLEVANRAGLAFAQFVLLTPFPGTVDFERWEKAQGQCVPTVAGVPLTRYWLLPPELRPKMFMPHQTMSGRVEAQNAGRLGQFLQPRFCVETLELRFFIQVSACTHLHFKTLPADVCEYRDCNR